MNTPRSAAPASQALFDPPDPHPTDPNASVVEFRIPADPTYVRVARLAVGDIGERAGFSLDELDDVRLAVDELCAIMLRAGGAHLRLRIELRDRLLVVDGSTDGASVPVAPSELSEMLLRALVDECRFGVRDDETTVEMRKRAREVA